jgi:hypothetical protein
MTHPNKFRDTFFYMFFKIKTLVSSAAGDGRWLAGGMT